jgi:hypothetical protein
MSLIWNKKKYNSKIKRRRRTIALIDLHRTCVPYDLFRLFVDVSVSLSVYMKDVRLSSKFRQRSLNWFSPTKKDLYFLYLI